MAIQNNVNIIVQAVDKTKKPLAAISKGFWGLQWKIKASSWKISSAFKWIWVALAASVWSVTLVWKQFLALSDNIETTMWKANTVFWEYIWDVKKVASETASAMGLSQNEYLKAASWLQDLLVPMWFAREEATKMTTDTIWLAGALAEWSAGQFDATQVSEILTKAMLWEREQLKSLWISISEADVQQRLLENWTKELTGVALQQAKAIATQQLIFEKSTDAQKSYADWADSLTRKQAEMRAAVNNAKEAIATWLIPVFHNLIKTVEPIITKFSESIQVWAWNKENIEKLEAWINWLIWVLKILWTVIQFIFWLIVKLWELIWDILAGIIVAFTDFKIFLYAIGWEIEKAVIWTWENILEWLWKIWTAIKDWASLAFTALSDFVNAKLGWILSFVMWIVDRIKSALKSVAWVFWGGWETTWGIDWARANGWPVSGWKTYLVGEKWPELFTPMWGWNITPNNELWGNSLSVSINMGWVSVWNQADESRLADTILEKLTRELQINKFWIV